MTSYIQAYQYADLLIGPYVQIIGPAYSPRTQ